MSGKNLYANAVQISRLDKTNPEILRAFIVMYFFPCPNCLSLIKSTNSMQPVINPQNQFIEGILLAVFQHY